MVPKQNLVLLCSISECSLLVWRRGVFNILKSYLWILTNFSASMGSFMWVLWDRMSQRKPWAFPPFVRQNAQRTGTWPINPKSSNHSIWVAKRTMISQTSIQKAIVIVVIPSRKNLKHWVEKLESLCLQLDGPHSWLNSLQNRSTIPRQTLYMN